VKPYPEKTRALFKVLVIALFKDKDRNCFCSVYSYKDRSGTEHEKEFEVHFGIFVQGLRYLILSAPGFSECFAFEIATSSFRKTKFIQFLNPASVSHLEEGVNEKNPKTSIITLQR